jgi:hypothetical protein
MAGIKTILFHGPGGKTPDLAYNEATVAKMKTALNNLYEKFLHPDAVKNHSQDVLDMMEDYIHWGENALTAYNNKVAMVKPGEKFTQYLAKADEALPAAPAAAVPELEGGVSVSQVPASATLRRLTPEGGLEVTQDQVIINEIPNLGRVNVAGSTQFNIEFEDGVTVRFRPSFNPQSRYDGDKSRCFSIQGEVEAFAKGGLSPERADAILERLASIGVNVAPPSEAELEVVYLKRMAGITNRDTSTTYQLYEELIKGLTPEEQAAKLREYWNGELKATLKKKGLSDVSQLANYNPKGRYYLGLRGQPGAAAGRRMLERFDFDWEDLKAEGMDQWGLYHQLYDAAAGRLKTSPRRSSRSWTAPRRWPPRWTRSARASLRAGFLQSATLRPAGPTISLPGSAPKTTGFTWSLSWTTFSGWMPSATIMTLTARRWGNT